MGVLILIAIAYTSATFNGQEIKAKGIQKYVGRIKEPERKERRHSNFYIGLYGQTWTNFSENCQELVADLLKLSPNKRNYYERGYRAMNLILSNF